MKKAAENPIGGTHWLVGRYREVAAIAKQLRDDKNLRDILTHHQVCIGLRKEDVPPKEVARQERYGPTVRGQDYQTDFTARRPNPLALPVHSNRPIPINRRGDREQNVKDYWATQTPRAHHIVEFNNLETLGVSHEIGDKEMDYKQLPAVLLAAEFHQRYISSILKPAQKLSAPTLRAGIAAVYQGLYQGRGQMFEPLWEISKIILKQAGITVI